MERKLDDVGHRVETGPGCGLISDITHAGPGRGEGGRIAAAAQGCRAALTAATGVGFLVGLCLAICSRAITQEKSQSFLGRRTRSGWRKLLRLA